MKTILNILFIVFFLQSVKAQFPNDIPYQSITTPNNLVIPNVGESVIDNSVSNPIQITRITEVFNYVDGNGDPQVWYPVHEYSKTQVWNADQTLFRILSWKVLDATTYQEVQSLSGAVYPSYWSNTNPDLIWSFQENGDIKKHTVSNNTTQTVANIPGYEFIKLGPGEGNIDNNDHYVALVGKKTNGDLDVIIFDLQALQIIHTKTFIGAWDNGTASFPKYIDWVSVSQSGNHVVIMWNHSTATDNGVNQYIENGNLHYGVEVYNTLDMQFQNRIIRYGNHGDLGYAVDGDEVLVQFYGLYGNGTLYMHKLNGTGSTVLTTNTDFGVAGHVSCRNINRPGWAYITHSLPNETGQLVAVKLDNSGLVEHFGHHFSSATSYDQAAMAVASPDGKKVCFKSDFGTGPNTNPSVSYIFTANLDPSLSVEENQLTNVKLYPNPSNNFINVESEERIKSIAVYNITGQIINTIMIDNSNKVKLNVKDLNSGLYYVRISSENGSILKKIMIQ
ncbi:MAG TPA: T9SS type A sorting domain-containing protein [Flavobacteriaceae bacterium]|nr:T9SS type A sorting domain-containing protein [Flavobacteriaceae bacterium]